MRTENNQLDIALERLINGESLDVLTRAYPALASELAQYANIRENAASFSSMKPDPDGLRRALSSMRVMDARAEALPSMYVRVSSFFVAYRTALVLPVLLIMLVATGAVVLPVGNNQPKNEDGTTEPVSSNDASRTNVDATAPASLSDGSQNSPMAMKMAPTTFSTQNATPQDQELASVFSDEMKSDSQQADTAQSSATSAADDSDALSTYENPYDANSI